MDSHAEARAEGTQSFGCLASDINAIGVNLQQF